MFQSLAITIWIVCFCAGAIHDISPFDLYPELTYGIALVDTDGDGLDDLIEDANNNGIVDPGETDPNDDDTDDDGLLDGNEDANANGVIDLNETDPLVFDSDIDGLGDGQEQGLTAPQGSDTDPGTFVPDCCRITMGITSSSSRYSPVCIPLNAVWSEMAISWLERLAFLALAWSMLTLTRTNEYHGRIKPIVSIS